MAAEKKDRAFFEKRYAELGGAMKEIRVPRTIRINTIRVSENVLVPRLAARGVLLEKISWLKHGYVVKEAGFSVGAMTEHLLGYFYLQEAAAQLAVEALAPVQGEFVVDACAAPGGKTTQISQHMNNKGVVFAFEKNKTRCDALFKNLERMGTANVVVYCKDFLDADFRTAPDRVLVDAPCSGNYAGDRRWVEKGAFYGIPNRQRTQRKLLAKAVSIVKKGGIVVYSTCSLEPEENELNIDWILRQGGVDLVDTGIGVGEPGLTSVFGQKLDERIAKCRRLWPHKTNTEGFFVAKLVKC